MISTLFVTNLKILIYVSVNQHFQLVIPYQRVLCHIITNLYKLNEKTTYFEEKMSLKQLMLHSDLSNICSVTYMQGI